VHLKLGTLVPGAPTFDPCLVRLVTDRLPRMTYVITTACVDVKHKACAAECPVDCIYEGDRTMYINPDECVECGACKLLCEVDAIYHDSELPENERKFLADNAAFFHEVLPGRDAPIGAPGGAGDLGPVGVDTPMVSGLPRTAG